MANPGTAPLPPCLSHSSRWLLRCGFSGDDAGEAGAAGPATVSLPVLEPYSVAFVPLSLAVSHLSFTPLRGARKARARAMAWRTELPAPLPLAARPAGRALGMARKRHSQPGMHAHHQEFATPKHDLPALRCLLFVGFAWPGCGGRGPLPLLQEGCADYVEGWQPTAPVDTRRLLEGQRFYLSSANPTLAATWEAHRIERRTGTDDADQLVRSRSPICLYPDNHNKGASTLRNPWRGGQEE